MFANLRTGWCLGLVLVAASTIVLLAPAQPSQAGTRTQLDAHCPGPRDIGFTGSRRHAQTFAAENTGKLKRAQVEINGNVEGQDFLMEIRTVDDSGVPTNEVLASAEINDVPAFTEPTLITGKFAEPVKVKQGQQYALSITDPANQGYIAGVRGDNACRGKEFEDPQATGDFFVTRRNDLVFNTFVKARQP